MLIGDDGEKIGLLAIDEALEKAQMKRRYELSYDYSYDLRN